MPTTSNFGWTTPADTDLVKDGAAAIRTLGNGIDTSLVDLKGGTTGQVLSKASNTDLDFTWVSDATGIQATIFDAKGDLIVASAADTAARLASSAVNGNVLTVDTSTATGLKWAAPAAGGKILQVVIDTHTTTETFSSTSFTDGALSVSITPSSASNKVLVMLASPGWKSPDTNGGGDVRILRDSTVIATMFSLGANENTDRDRQMAVINILDTPNTTSAITYKVQARTISSPGEWRMSVNDGFGSLIAMEVAA